MTEPEARKLVYRFLELPHVCKLEIADTMGIEVGDMPDQQAYDHIILTAKNTNRLGELEQKIAEQYDEIE